MHSREDKITFESFLKRSWPTLLFGALVCVGISFFLFELVLNGGFQSINAVVVNAVEELHPPANRRLLDGVIVDTEKVNNIVFASMIDNSPDAWPLSGPAEANLVIEAPVEGGITRLMVVFDGGTELDTIGPVRSARPYFVEWADALSAVYAHVGGSPTALDQIKKIEDFRDLNEFGHPLRFTRSPKRFMPHNAFTSAEDLQLFSQIREWTTSDFTSWVYLNETDQPMKGELATSSTHDEIRIPYGGPWSVKWTYDTETDSYLRYQGTAVQKDIDGSEVYAKNVVVMLTSATVVDEVGRLNLRTTGQGRAILFHDGARYDGSWSRDAGEWIRFTDENGNDLVFTAGKTWISVVTSESMMPK
ncbi:MAG: DUF3048 domain-containing protein [bacterium]|nr:DUF3048 domain-containing protein [bacterium]